MNEFKIIIINDFPKKFLAVMISPPPCGPLPTDEADICDATLLQCRLASAVEQRGEKNIHVGFRVLVEVQCAELRQPLRVGAGCGAGRNFGSRACGLELRRLPPQSGRRSEPRDRCCSSAAAAARLAPGAVPGSLAAESERNGNRPVVGSGRDRIRRIPLV